MSNCWSGSFTVRAGEADLYGRANMKTLFQYLEEAAYQHAEQLELSYHHMKEKGAFWVLFRLRLEMMRYPRWTEKVTVETWTRGFSRLLAQRDFLIKDTHDRILGRAASQWLLLDILHRKPLRPETIFSTPMLGTERKALEAEMIATPQAESYSDSYRIISRYADLDVNGHVNNVRYVEWALNSMEASWYKHKIIRILQMEYLEETQDRCTILLEKGSLDDNSLSIRAVKESIQKPVFRAFLRWEEIGREKVD